MISVNIYGINVNVDSDTVEYSKLVNESLAYFKEKKNNDSFETIYTIDVKVLINEKVKLQTKIKGLKKIGNTAYLGKNTYCCVMGRKFIEFKKYEETLKIYIYSLKYNSIYTSSRLLIKSILFKKDYFLLFRHTVIFPIFWALARFKQIYVMHSGGNNLSGIGLALPGLAGIGKSTISLALTLINESLFLGDNYILFDDRKLYAFPELIRISNNTKTILGKSVTKLGQAKLSRNGKQYYNLHYNYISDPVDLSFMIMPSIGESNHVRELSVSVALDRIILSNNHTKELPEHSMTGLIEYLFEFENSIYCHKIKTLENLLRNTKIYEASTRKDCDRNELCHFYNNLCTNGMK